MGKFDGMLLVSDLDGTLLNDQKQVPQANLDAIRYFQKEGGVFTLGTGRTYETSRVFYHMAEANAPIVCFNGSALYDFAKEDFVWYAAIEDTAFCTIVDEVEQAFPGIGIEVYTARQLYFHRENAFSDAHLAREPLDYVVQDYHTDPTHIWMKSIFTDSPERLQQVEAFVQQQRYTERFPSIRFVYSEKTFFELLGKEGTKGTGLLALAKYLGIDRTRTCAIGDNYNDEEMLQDAGMSFCPENGVPEMKALAGMVTRNNNAGAIADAVAWMEQNWAK